MHVTRNTSMSHQMAHLHEEIAKAPLVRTSRADQVVHICTKCDALTRGRSNVRAVAGEFAVITEVHSECSPFVDVDVFCWRGKGDRRGKGSDSCGELHIEEEEWNVIGSSAWGAFEELEELLISRCFEKLKQS